MTLFERIKFLAEERGQSINDVEKSLKYSKNTMYRLKKNKPGSEKLEEIADYFDVSTDYLLGRTDKRRYYDLTSQDKKDIGEEVDAALRGAFEGGKVNFYGEPVSEDDLEKIRDAMIIAYELSRKEAKKKFTPKKHRD